MRYSSTVRDAVRLALDEYHGTHVSSYPTQVHCPGPIGGFYPGQDARRGWCHDVELGAHHLVPLGVLDATRGDALRRFSTWRRCNFLPMVGSIIRRLIRNEPRII